MLSFDMTWDSIITALGGTGAVATELSLAEPTVSGWRKRGIPSAHWAAIVALAGECERSDVSLQVLAELAARKRSALHEEVRA